MGDAWQGLAACRDADPDLFTDNMETWVPDPAAVAICNLCPVRVECLKYALDHPDLWGTWASTSHAQRRQLRRRYRRVLCPAGCGAGGVLVEVDGGQVCLGCAVSWRATPARLPAGG